MEKIIIPGTVISEFKRLNCHWLEDFLEFPTFCLNWREESKSFVNIQKTRKERLLNRSPYEKSFIDTLTDLKINFFEEVPILIEDRELWNNLLDYNQIKEDSTERVRCYHQVDFIVRGKNLIFEIDSDVHIHKKQEDSARDKYLEIKYGFKTVRYDYYTKDLYDSSEILDEINKAVPIRYLEFPINLERTVYHYYREILTGIQNLQKYTKGNLLYSKLDIFAFTSKDFSLAGVAFYSSEISKAVKDWFGKIVYVHRTPCDFTISELIKLLNSGDPWKNWDKKDIVPGWMIAAVGKPPKDYRYDLSKGYFGVRTLIKKLKDLGLL